MRKYSIAFVLFAIAVMVLGVISPAAAHYPDAVIYSSQAATVPTIDGSYNPVPGEWEDATLVDLGALNPQPMKAYGYFKHDVNFLYVLIDVIDDTTNDIEDESHLDFDTGHDLIASDGADDQFWIYGDGDTYHVVYDSSGPGYVTHCAPFDTGLPLHAGLAAAAGMSSSPYGAGAHRVYEYKIPLALIQVSPGSTIGFGMGATEWYGIWDESPGPEPDGNCWPISGYDDGFGMDDYGNLVLGPAPAPVGGIAVPVNKLSLLTPYLALVGLIGAVTGAVGLMRRRKT